jgi:hypothetical protein
VRVGPPLPGADQNRELPDLDVEHETTTKGSLADDMNQGQEKKTFKLHNVVFTLQMERISSNVYRGKNQLYYLFITYSSNFWLCLILFLGDVFCNQ